MGVEQLPGWPEIYDGTMGKKLKARNGEMNGNGTTNGFAGDKTSETSGREETKEKKAQENVDVLICGGKEINWVNHSVVTADRT